MESIVDSVESESKRAVIGGETQNLAPNSGTFMDSAFFSPETFMPYDFLLHESEAKTSYGAEVTQAEIPKATVRKKIRKIEINRELPQSSHSLGLIASISVGVVIAFFLFPMIRYAERSTRSYVTESWKGEISRRVNQYEQIYSNVNPDEQEEELQSFNLALSGWQELSSETLLDFLLQSSESNMSFSEEIGYLQNTYLGRMQKSSYSGQDDEQEMQGRWQNPFGKSSEFSEQRDLILANANRRMQIVVPLGSPLGDTMEGSVMRSAFGQGITMKDGRVFFRVLPTAETVRR